MIKTEITNLINRAKDGGFKARKERIKFILYFIDILSILNICPINYKKLNRQHLIKVIEYLKNNKYSNSHIYNIISNIRYLVVKFNLGILKIDNKSLGILNKFHNQHTKVDCEHYIKQIDDEIVRLIFGLQIYFGLTFKESILISPDIHILDLNIAISKEISSFSKDRTIKIVDEHQKKIIIDLKNYLQHYQSILLKNSPDTIRVIYKNKLSNLSLSTSISYRYFYAIKRFKYLEDHKSIFKPIDLIGYEMGVSRSTVLRYINE